MTAALEDSILSSPADALSAGRIEGRCPTQLQRHA